MSILFCKLPEFDKEDDQAATSKKELEIKQCCQIEDIIRKGHASQVMRRLQQESAEEKLEKEIFEERNRKIEQAKQREKAQIRAEAEKKEYREKLYKEKTLQQIRSSTQELRDLERQLRACYVGKENLMRIKENEMYSNSRKELLRREHEMEEQKRKDEEERDRLMKADEERRKYALRLVQQKQIIESQKRREEAYRAFVQEKLMMDLVAQELIEEDRQRELARMMSLKATRKQIEDFLAAREQWKQRLREEMDQENLRIQHYLDSQVDRSAEEKRIQKEKWEKHNIAVNKIAAKIYAEEQRALEKETILQNLAEIEADEAHEKRIREEMEAAIRSRKDLKVAMHQQRKERAIILKQEQDEEMEMRKMMLQDLAEKERIEQMTKERKRIRILEHRAAVDRIIQERKLKRHIEMEKILREEEEEAEMAREHDQLVEEERLKMLREHAHKLLGFMPKGILREGDEEKLGPEFTRALRQHSQRTPCT